MGKLIDRIVDRWLTWRTGKDRETRAWHAWYDAMVNHQADNIDDIFKNFRHVIVVDIVKFTDYQDPFSWTPCADAKQYFWPQCALADTAAWRFERVVWDPASERWQRYSLGEDHIFVATNSDDDAMVIALKYA